MLNMILPYWRNLYMSEYNALDDPFGFNKITLTPPGKKIIINDKPYQRASLDSHFIDGWYLGPEQEHYWCGKVYANKTQVD